MNIYAIYKIIRPVNLVITFFSVVIAAIISSSIAEINSYVFLVALSVTFSFAAGNVINDVIDFEIDKINRPERVLPRGILSLNLARVLYGILFAASLILAVIVSIDVLVIIFFLNLLLLIYSTHLKKKVLLSNFIVAFATAVPLLLGGLVVNNFNGGLIPAGFAFFTNFIREIIKDIEDVKGDSSKGVKTFPQKAGVDKAIIFGSTLLSFLMILDTLPYIFKIYNIEYFLIIMTFVNPIYVYALKLLFTKPDLESFRKISSWIKVSMIIGLFAILLGAQ